MILFIALLNMKIWTMEEEALRLSERFANVKNKAEFARAYNLKGGASMLSQHLSGNRPISIDAAVVYAKAFNCTVAEISPRIALQLENANKTALLPENSFLVGKSVNEIPVYGKGMGGLPDRLFTDEGRLSNGHDEYGEVYSSDINAFITRVEGNSMIPKYHHGGYALVEPNTEPELEDDVLIKLTSGQVLLKKLVSRRGGVVLASYSDPVIHTFSPDQIVWMYYVAYPVPTRKIKSRI